MQDDTPWQRIKAAFDALMDLPPQDREAALQATTLDPDQQAEVRSLLAHHDGLDDTGGQPFLAAAPRPEGLEGRRFGPWLLTRRVGAGGMGEVFEAERADGSFAGRAAIKLLAPGRDGPALLARFAQERQALARLNHPHIAHLMDAGVADDGQPYVVMEFVDGRPIDDVAAALPLEGRLALVLQLCEAVAYAHRQLLVHRDLKPGNVLVDAQGQVKLLDFGIAKAIDGGDPLITGVAHTPHYASPEQVRGEPVGTATDLYSLGVLTYQLLTGVRPTGRQATTAQEAARSVLEDTPTRPSRLSGDEVPDPDWPATRARLAGDLDNILLKALEKEPERRYASVDAFAADLRAYLGGYPVSARPAAWSYRARKWLQRNPVAAGLSASLLLAVLGGLAATAWQAHEARLAQQTAEQRLAEVRRVTHSLVFGFGDSVEYLPGGQDIKIGLLRDTLAALERLRPTLGEDTALLADIAQVHVRLGEAHMPGYLASRNDLATATRHAQAARELVDRVWAAQRGHGDFVSYASRAYNLLASVDQEADRIEASVALMQQGLALVREAMPQLPPGPDRLRAQGAITATLVNVGNMLDDNGVGLGRRPEAQAAYREALASADAELADPAAIAAVEATLPPQHTRFAAETAQSRAIILGSWSSSLLRDGDYAGALERRRASVAELRRAHETHPEQQQFWQSLCTALSFTAQLELQLAHPAEALAAMRESLQWNERLQASEPDNPQWTDNIGLRALPMGTALAATGALAESLPWFQRAIAYAQAELAKKEALRPRRNLLTAQLRLALAEQALKRPGAGARVLSATEALQALQPKDAKSPDTLLAVAEGAAALASPAVGGEKWRGVACEAWRQAATRRPLSPAALRARGVVGCE
ncbi:serine/threonine-protein kinase [Roseateles paludis]|jgi:hypothetical protein|uniref:Serine/threonine-protein kinase n=1 Tax=Roseateles paludis TaxID=3145238 RepID=A0ABV0FZJ1_9BURK